MRIDKISISNILSFGYLDDSAMSSVEIDFLRDSYKKNINILIGPNGSGKSNLLEIINQIVGRVLFKRAEYNKSTFKQRNPDGNFPGNQQNIIKHTAEKCNYLSKNIISDNEFQRVDITIGIGPGDHRNLDFIYDRMDEINVLFHSYSQYGPPFSKSVTVYDDKKKEQTTKQLSKLDLRIDNISLNINRNNEKEDFKIDIPHSSIASSFVKSYLEYFDAIQRVIELKNDSESDNIWEPLEDTFAIIGCYRNYNGISLSYSVSEDEHSQYSGLEKKRYEEDTTTANNEEPNIFNIVKFKLTNKVVNLVEEGTKNVIEALAEIKTMDMYKKINRDLKTFLGISMEVHFNTSRPWLFNIVFKKNEEKIDIQNFSAGEKGIFHLIFSLYGYDIENGMILIDEPELHLHPQFQIKYLDILHKHGTERNIQSIVATHSPIFVNEKTIKGLVS